MNANFTGNFRDATAVSRGQEREALIDRLNRAARRQPTIVLGVLQYWLGPHVKPAGAAVKAAGAVRSPSL
jgi:hypothetical protein